MSAKKRSKNLLGKILVEKGYITQEQLQEALSEQDIAGETLNEVLIRKEFIGNQSLNEISKTPGATMFDIKSYVIDPEAIKLIPEDIAIKYKVIPVSRTDDSLMVAVTDLKEIFIVEELARITGLKVETILADEDDILKVLAQCYGSSEAISKIISTIGSSQATSVKNIDDGVAVTKLVDTLVKEAIACGSSDIHFEPEGEVVRVRFRIDGMLHYHTILEKQLGPLIASRLKVMGDLDIAEKRIPQDGRIILKVGKKDIDFRISTCPTVWGENVVLRILDKSQMVIGFNNLGLSSDDIQKVSRLLKQPHGIILVTGPTGSGKTTTLYNFLHRMNNETVNIMTIEDPIEYQFLLIRQSQILPRIGYNFAQGLRSFLRQDPDIIMVGEIRDQETAAIAVQAALTGHLVLSSFHTNDAAVAFSRLINMGIEPFFVSDSVRGIIAQRLIRKICPHCKVEYKPTPVALKFLKLQDRVDDKTRFYRGEGCSHCRDTGYYGREGIFEVLIVTPEIQTLIAGSATAEEIVRMASTQGLKTLRDSAIERLLQGTTTIEEVMRST